MSTTIRPFILSLAWACCAVSYAQEWTPVPVDVLLARIEANKAKYTGLENYELDAVLSAYRSSTDVAPQDRGTSTVWKVGSRCKAVHLGMTSYQDERIRITIDEDERMILIASPFDPVASIDPAARREVLAGARSIGHRKEHDGDHYRVKFPTTSEYDLVEMVFDEQGWLRRVDTYWARPVELDPGTSGGATILPKVVLELAVPKVLRSPAAVDADPASVVSFSDAGGPVAIGPWKGYEVFDTRVR